MFGNMVGDAVLEFEYYLYFKSNWPLTLIGLARRTRCKLQLSKVARFLKEYLSLGPYGRPAWSLEREVPLTCDHGSRPIILANTCFIFIATTSEKQKKNIIKSINR